MSDHEFCAPCKVDACVCATADTAEEDETEQTRAAAPAQAPERRDARAHADVDNPRHELTEYDKDGNSESVTSSNPMTRSLSLAVACADGPDRRRAPAASKSHQDCVKPLLLIPLSTSATDLMRRRKSKGAKEELTKYCAQCTPTSSP